MNVLTLQFFKNRIQELIRKKPYFSQMDVNQKNKGTLLSQTLKVEENKVPS